MSVRVLSSLFRRRLLEALLRVHQAGKLQFFGEQAALADATAFKAWLTPLHRFMLHVLPGGLHRIRHCGLLANGARKTNLALARELLHVLPAQGPAVGSETNIAEISVAAPPAFICRHCGHAMNILQTFMRGESIRAPPGPACTP